MDSQMRGSLRPWKLVIVVADVAGFARAFRQNSDEVMAHFIDRYYQIAHRIITAKRGTVVKFIGDACHAVFEEDKAAAAVECVLELERAVRNLGNEFQMDVGLGANVHSSTVVAGEFGGTEFGRFDVIGSGVNYAFLMGKGPGLRISEPVYRRLASAKRTPWQKMKSPVTYHFAGDNVAGTAAAV